MPQSLDEGHSCGSLAQARFVGQNSWQAINKFLSEPVEGLQAVPQSKLRPYQRLALAVADSLSICIRSDTNITAAMDYSILGGDRSHFSDYT